MNMLMTISNEIANQPARVRSPFGRLCIMKRKWSMEIVDSLNLFIDIWGKLIDIVDSLNSFINIWGKFICPHLNACSRSSLKTRKHCGMKTSCSVAFKIRLENTSKVRSKNGFKVKSKSKKWFKVRSKNALKIFLLNFMDITRSLVAICFDMWRF